MRVALRACACVFLQRKSQVARRRESDARHWERERETSWKTRRSGDSISRREERDTAAWRSLTRSRERKSDDGQSFAATAAGYSDGGRQCVAAPRFLPLDRHVVPHVSLREAASPATLVERERKKERADDGIHVGINNQAACACHTRAGLQSSLGREASGSLCLSSMRPLTRVDS